MLLSHRKWEALIAKESIFVTGHPKKNIIFEVIVGNHIKGCNQWQGPCSGVILNCWPPNHCSYDLCLTRSTNTLHLLHVSLPVQLKVMIWLISPRWPWSELRELSGVPVCPDADPDCCTHQPAATSLPHFCCPLCCSSLLFTCAFTCMLSLYAKTDCVTTTWGKWQHLCTTPCFQAYFNTCN